SAAAVARVRWRGSAPPRHTSTWLGGATGAAGGPKAARSGA
nr:hypothetical protein [Tanacetum cinerariifolium]